MEDRIREQIQFALCDNNEGMQAALNPDSDLDKENKHMNRELTQQDERILVKLNRDESLSQEDLALVRDANAIRVDDSLDLGSRHRQALALDTSLDQVMDMSRQEAMRVLEQWLDRSSRVPARARKVLQTLWEGLAGDDTNPGPAFDGEGKCLRCGSRVSLADVADTVVFADNEIVKRYPGDITNRNLARCNHPGLYPEFREHDRGD